MDSRVDLFELSDKVQSTVTRLTHNGGQNVGTLHQLSIWHTFDQYDRRTYPTANASVQVKYADGRVKEGDSTMFFPRLQLLSRSTIKNWRYIKKTQTKRSQKRPSGGSDGRPPIPS